MAVNTQRLFVFIILVNLAVGWVQTIYQDPTSEDTSQITVESQLLTQYEQDMKDEESGYLSFLKKAGSAVWDSPVMAPLKGLYIIGEILVRGLLPFPFRVSDFTNPIETQMAYILNFFRGLIWLIMAIEGFMLWYAKKQS